MEKYNKKTTVSRKTINDLKRREFEQTQELLVSLTNELFEKVEKINVKSRESKTNPRITLDKSSQEEAENSENQKAKIMFSDLSWYKKRLENTQK